MISYYQRNDHIPTMTTKERVKACVWAGLNQQQIADALEISRDTLIKYYQKELNNTLGQCITTLGMTAMTEALNGDKQMLMFCLKTRGAKYGWQEKQTIEVGASPELEQLSQQLAALEQDNLREY